MERDIVASIMRFLKNEGSCFVWKTHGNQFSAGIPDIIACVRGRFVAFEVKQPGGKPTIRLHRGAADKATELGITEVLISISHCKSHATATAIAVGE